MRAHAPRWPARPVLPLLGAQASAEQVESGRSQRALGAGTQETLASRYSCDGLMAELWALRQAKEAAMALLTGDPAARAAPRAPLWAATSMFHGCGFCRVKGPAGCRGPASRDLPRDPSRRIRPAAPARHAAAAPAPAPAPARTTTSMEHRCCPDHGDVTSTWLAGPAGHAGPAPGAPPAPPAPAARTLSREEPLPGHV